ncbi:glycerophosphoryl diester phosphodiesterase [Acinetobacter calcoaceticus]|uniref:Glycerophosphoryl diester phosphodiesterase n=1 Tax=Acinetobacter calcoaceticus TaxID=471 RepID=A0A4R1XUF7_ACICA|nr:glycerophosphoryl diester phosphodiesterase [Acinetobacter calcoaceticus]
MQIIGHRGARGEAPENTLVGFEYLRDLGLSAVEFDVRQLADHELIVMHDDNFIRTAGVVQDLYACTHSELLGFNQASSWPNWPIQATPLLSQALKIMTGFQHIEVEVKAVENMAEAERLVVRLQQELQGFEHNAVITSFDQQVLAVLQQQSSPFKRGLLIENPRLKHPIELALSYGCCQIGWMDSLATNERIAATHQADLQVSVWTVNDIDRAKQLRELGVNGLITDFPKRFQQQLNSA